MNLALLRKTINDSKWLLLACTVGLFVFCWLRVWVVTQMDTSNFQNIIDSLPAFVKSFIPVDVEWLITYAGRISITYDDAIVLVCISVWSIARGSDCVSGQIDRGTMEMLLAQPISRLQVLLTHSVVTVAGVGLLSLTTWVGIYAGLHTFSVKETVKPTFTLPFKIPGIGREVPIPYAEPVEQIVPMSERVDPNVYWPAVANLFALGLFLAGFSAVMSSWDRYRWRTIGIVVGVYVVQLMVKLLGMAMSRVPDGGGELERHWLMYGSVFTAYEPEVFVRIADLFPDQAWSLFYYSPQGEFLDMGPLGYDLIFLALGGTCYALAAMIFCRRDLPAPL